MSNGAVAGLGVAIVGGIGMMVLAFGSIYTVNEGHVGVVTQWGKAVSQEGPMGVRFKAPIMTQINEFDVRERRAESPSMAAATANQLPITANISANWRLDPSQILDIYINYGSPEAFESTILMPRLNQAAKAGLSRYQASELIRDRTAASNAILALVQDAMEDYPAVILTLQIDNVEMPPQYLSSVMAKEQAREDAAKEEYNLQKQRLESQREVQTAEAERDAAKARADGEAYRIREEAKADAEATMLAGEAEASAIKVVQDALEGDPLLVEYEKAKRWNGQMPTTILGSSPDVLMSLPPRQ